MEKDNIENSVAITEEATTESVVETTPKKKRTTSKKAAAVTVEPTAEQALSDTSAPTASIAADPDGDAIAQQIVDGDPYPVNETDTTNVPVDVIALVGHADPIGSEGRKGVSDTEQAPQDQNDTDEPNDNQKVIKQDLLTEHQLHCLKRCLGWNDNNAPKAVTKNGQTTNVLYSYRNRYFADPKPHLEDMVAKGILAKGSFGVTGTTYTGYYATEQGIKFLEDAAGIHIVSVSKRGK